MGLSTTIRWSDNTEQLKRNLLDGIGTVEKLQKSIGDTTKAFSDELGPAGERAASMVAQRVGLLQAASKAADAEVRALQKDWVQFSYDAEKRIGIETQLGEAVIGAQALYGELSKTKKALTDTGEAGQQAGGMLGSATKLVEGFVAAFVVDKIVSTGKAALSAAAQFADLADESGLSIKAIQQFAYVGAGFNLDAATMAKAVENFSTRLSRGDTSARAAVLSLNLSVQDLIKAGPTEAFLRMADAAGRLTDPMLKTALAGEVMGDRIGRRLAPVLGEMRQGMDEATKAGAIMSDETVKMADRFDDAAKRMEIRAKAFVANWLMPMIQGLKEIGTANVGSTGIEDLNGDISVMGRGTGKDIELQAESITNGVSRAQAALNLLRGLQKEAATVLTGTQRRMSEQFSELGMGAKEIAAQIGAPAAAVDRFLKAAQHQKQLIAEIDKAAFDESQEAQKRFVSREEQEQKKKDDLFIRMTHDYNKEILKLNEQIEDAALGMALQGVDAELTLNEYRRKRKLDLLHEQYKDHQEFAAEEERLVDYENVLFDIQARRIMQNHNLVLQSTRTLQAFINEGWQKTFGDAYGRTRSFADAFKSVWDELQVSMSKVFAAMLSSFMSGLLKPMVTRLSKSLNTMLSGMGGGESGEGGGFLGAIGTGLLGALKFLPFFAADGIMADKPTLTVFGEGRKAEVGGSQDFFKQVFSDLGVGTNSNPGPAGSGGGGPVTVNVTFTGAVTEELVTTKVVPLIVRAVNGNVRQARTNLRAALGTA